MNKWTYATWTYATRTFATAIAAMTLISNGCNQPTDLATKPIPVVEAADATTHSVAVADVDAQSPAIDVDPIPAKDASPVDVCRAFVNFLNSGESTNVELMLTPTALTVTSRLDFQIPPIGDANSNCNFSEPQFSTTKQKLCYVECTLSDNDDSEALITWMLRKKRQGWRVAGMMVEDTSNKSVNLISFENPRDVQQVKSELQGGDATGSVSE